MKTLITSTILCFVLAAIFGTIYALREYRYNVHIGQYVDLADDASTPQAKLKYFRQYQQAVQDKITRSDARYIFKRQRLTKATQLEIVQTLIQRLEELRSQPVDSLGYQQGMLQVSGQEFDHTLDFVDSVFKDCYFRNSFFVYASPGFSLIFLLATIIGFLLWVHMEYLNV